MMVKIRLRKRWRERAKAFLQNDRGAISIDWVVLGAGVLLIGVILVYGLYSGGVSSVSKTVNATLKDAGSVTATPTHPELERFE